MKDDVKKKEFREKEIKGEGEMRADKRREARMSGGWTEIKKSSDIVGLIRRES
jgi:hypothetical protein